MVNNNVVQCDSKIVLVDAFELNDISVRVFLQDNKKSVKRYCKETDLEYSIGIGTWYKNRMRIVGVEPTP